MPNTTSALAARTKSLLQDLPWTGAGLCWHPVGRWFPASPSLQFKESPCSTAQGELQVHAEFGKPFAIQNYYFSIVFYYYFPNSTSHGWVKLLVSCKPTTTSMLVLPIIYIYPSHAAVRPKRYQQTQGQREDSATEEIYSIDDLAPNVFMFCGSQEKPVSGEKWFKRFCEAQKMLSFLALLLSVVQTL